MAGFGREKAGAGRAPRPAPLVDPRREACSVGSRLLLGGIDLGDQGVEDRLAFLTGDLDEAPARLHRRLAEDLALLVAQLDDLDVGLFDLDGLEALSVLLVLDPEHEVGEPGDALVQRLLLLAATAGNRTFSQATFETSFIALPVGCRKPWDPAGPSHGRCRGGTTSSCCKVAPD